MMDQLNILAWAGRSQTETGGVDAGMAQQIHATLGTPGHRAPEAGDLLDPLWHWCALAPSDPTRDLRADGHPRAGDFLPPLRLPRRMWAGGQLRFHRPARVGDPLERRSVVANVDQKSDTMVLIRVNHEIHGPQGLVLEERQDIVYLPIPEEFIPPAKRAMPNGSALLRSHPMTEALLFRFSAITFNAHRIHYDIPYAQEVEKYPGLVVHGPLQAMLLMRAACDARNSTPTDFSFRALHPMFAGSDLQIAADDGEDGELRLCTGQDGHQGMVATALFQGVV